MNPTMLLTQMLPLIVFIVVDAVFNNIKASIISAVVFAIGQLIFYFIKTGQFDWFVLLDVGLIVGLGTVSLILKNEMFFKIKPAVIEIAAIIFLMVMALSPDSFLLNYFGRMMPKGSSINPLAVGMMKTMIFWMCGYMLVHIGAVLYTAFFSSRKMWAFVSGPGFYLLFIPVMVFLLVKALKKKRQLRNKNAPPRHLPVFASMSQPQGKQGKKK
jgi:intracellular septation protein A